MKKIFICLLLLIASNACINNEQKNKTEVKFNFPIGNKIISQSKIDINKLTIESLKIEYMKFYDSITKTINDTLNNKKIKFSNAYYFSKEEDIFFNSLNQNNSISCMALIEQSNVNFKIYIIKNQSNNLEISEGHGYKNELFLVSVSEKNNEILDVINIYNDGIMLYWQCVRFFHIDKDLNIYLKDYSINEGDYKCINNQVFNFTSEGYFKRNDTLSKNDTIITDSINNFYWNGIYNFNQTFLRYMDEFEITYSIKITNEHSAKLTTSVNDKTEQFSVDITSFDKDSLLLNYMDNNEDPEELIVYKTNDGYEIGGRTIYLLNPPNDRYPIIKE